jgi:hypothetical protein
MDFVIKARRPILQNMVKCVCNEYQVNDVLENNGRILTCTYTFYMLKNSCPSECVLFG